MAELSSAGNTYATTGGQFLMPLTIIGAGGTAPNQVTLLCCPLRPDLTGPDFSQALGAEHSQPFHAYVMGIPGLKICTAASPAAAYGITKAMVGQHPLPRLPPSSFLPALSLCKPLCPVRRSETTGQAFCSCP